MTILEKLNSDSARIVDIELSIDRKTVELREACDGYFHIDLNKFDFGLLIEELKEIHGKMEI